MVEQKQHDFVQQADEVMALLAEFAAGGVSPALRLLVQSYCAMDAHAARMLAACEAVGGQLLESLPASALSDTLTARQIMDMAMQNSQPIKVTLPAADGIDWAAFPQPLQAQLGKFKKPLKWRRFGRSTHFITLPVGGQDTLRLIRVKAGQPVLHHEHKGMEYTLILQGAFNDGAARFGQGELCIMPEGTDHKPVATADQDCFCLIVNQGSIRLREKFSTLVREVLPF